MKGTTSLERVFYQTTCNKSTIRKRALSKGLALISLLCKLIRNCPVPWVGDLYAYKWHINGILTIPYLRSKYNQDDCGFIQPIYEFFEGGVIL